MKINGKEYAVPELDMNAMCDLEDKGVNLIGADEKNPRTITMIRGFIAWIENVSEDEAGEELQAHLLSGGDLGTLFTEIMTAVNESGFFKSLKEKKKAEKIQIPQDHKKSRKVSQK